MSEPDPDVVWFWIRRRWEPRFVGHDLVRITVEDLLSYAAHHKISTTVGVFADGPPDPLY